MAKRLVHDIILDPHGDPDPGFQLNFRVNPSAVTVDGLVPPKTVTVFTEDDGTFAVELVTNVRCEMDQYAAWAVIGRSTSYPVGTKNVPFVVPDGDGPISLRTILASQIPDPADPTLPNLVAQVQADFDALEASIPGEISTQIANDANVIAAAEQAVASTDMAPFVGPLVPPLVASALAADDTPAQAAALAVTAEIAGRDMVEGDDPRIPQPTIDERFAYAVTDQSGNASWIAVSDDGRVPPHSAKAITDVVLHGAETGESLDNDVAGGVTDQSGNASWVAWRADGTPPEHTVTMLRDALGIGEPSGTAVVHFVGDLHTGQAGTAARFVTMTPDFNAITPLVRHRVYVGDIVTTPGDTTMLADAATMLDGFDAPDRRDLVGGNHDYNQFTSSETGSIFMARWGYAERNWVRDLGAIRLIGLTADKIGAGDAWMTLTSADLAWLEARLEETSRPCAIVTHAPLSNTVLTGPFTSTDPNFYAHPDANIRTLLNAHGNAVAWISGHTHTDVTDPDILKLENVGTRSIAALNCSAIAYIGGISAAASPLQSPVVTFRADGLDVRWRDHENAAWMTVNGQQVASVAYLDLI